MGEEGRGDEREEEEARRVPRGWPRPRRRAHARVRPRDEDLDRSARRRWRTHVLRTQRGAPRVWTVQQVLPREPDVRGAKDLVETNIDVLHKVAEVLLEKENIDGDEFQTIMLACGAGLYLKEDSPATKVPYQTA